MKKFFAISLMLSALLAFGCDDGSTGTTPQNTQNTQENKTVVTTQGKVKALTAVNKVTTDAKLPDANAPKQGSCKFLDKPVCQGNRLFVCTPFEANFDSIEKIFNTLDTISDRVEDLAEELDKKKVNPISDPGFQELLKQMKAEEQKLKDLQGLWVDYGCADCKVGNPDRIPDKDDDDDDDIGDKFEVELDFDDMDITCGGKEIFD